MCRCLCPNLGIPACVGSSHTEFQVRDSADSHLFVTVSENPFSAFNPITEVLRGQPYKSLRMGGRPGGAEKVKNLMVLASTRHPYRNGVSIVLRREAPSRPRNINLAREGVRFRFRRDLFFP